MASIFEIFQCLFLRKRQLQGKIHKVSWSLLHKNDTNQTSGNVSLKKVSLRRGTWHVLKVQNGKSGPEWF